MICSMAWHGGLLVAAMAAQPSANEGAAATMVRSRVFDVEYSVNEESLPLDSVRLWYRFGPQGPWMDYGVDEDRQSPMACRIPGEGLIGLFLVMTNATGPSSQPPTDTTRPHRWVFVDYTPPVVQLHELRQSSSLGQRILQIRWTAIDAHLPARPVELAYRQPPSTTWTPMIAEPVANTGRFDWRVPVAVVGPLSVRLAVRDKGGHRAVSEEHAVELASSPTRSQPPPVVLAARDRPGQPQRRRGIDTTPKQPRRRRAIDATPTQPQSEEQRLFAEALDFKQRAEYRKGISRLRRALKLNPQWAEAFAEMADMLYRVGDADRALAAYQLALRQAPTLRSALRGAAEVYSAKSDYDAAGRLLRKILRFDPKDAEVWMNLGDIAVFQGDEILARECYTRATRIDPLATQVINDAEKRLDLMRQSSARYEPAGGGG